MPYANSDAGVKVYEKDADGLALSATVGTGTPPTTADLYAVGCRVTALDTGNVYRNVGTSASPVWEIN
jgi:hypothetical protein